jgi:FkbM family methyltransferase
MKMIRGMYWPDHQKEGWIHELAIVDGLLAYQLDTLKAAVAACSKPRVVIDGGAHVGLWTLPLARLFKRVLAFEPQTDNADCLEANCAGWQNVIISRKALSDREGEGDLRGNRGKTVGWSLSRFRDEQTGQAVPLVRIDSLALGKLDLVKLDVEGHEFETLMGGEQTIREHRPVIVIEEKLDPEYRASALLEQWGARCTYTKKYDKLYTWR